MQPSSCCTSERLAHRSGCSSEGVSMAIRTDFSRRLRHGSTNGSATVLLSPGAEYLSDFTRKRRQLQVGFGQCAGYRQLKQRQNMRGAPQIHSPGRRTHQLRLYCKPRAANESLWAVGPGQPSSTPRRGYSVTDAQPPEIPVRMRDPEHPGEKQHELII